MFIYNNSICGEHIRCRILALIQKLLNYNLYLIYIYIYKQLFGINFVCKGVVTQYKVLF